MTILGIIFAIVIAIMILNLLSSLGKALPLFIIYFFFYWLSNYLWVWLCWFLAILFTLGLIYYYYLEHKNEKSKYFDD